MFENVLVVCVGNICRSPTGERLLQAALPGKHISSAGVAALVGHAADEVASGVATDNGLSLAGHSARQLTRALCQQADLILVMKDGQIIERGKHADLLARGGFYSQLYRSQFAKLPS